MYHPVPKGKACANQMLAAAVWCARARQMIRVDTLPAQIAARLQGRNLIVFDGECVFCSAVLRFMLRHDGRQTFACVTA
jgi:hypothetical protein